MPSHSRLRSSRAELRASLPTGGGRSGITGPRSSVGVIVAGTLIILYDLYVADLLATLAISAYILYQGVTLMARLINILMEGTPEGVDTDDVVATSSTWRSRRMWLSHVPNLARLNR